MAKVAFVSQPRDAVAATDAQTGSVTIVMWELAKRVSRHHEVVVFAPRASGQPVEEVSRAGPRILRIPLVLRSFHKAMDLGTGALNLDTPYFASTLFFREYALSIARWLRHERPDIVHVQNCTQVLPLFHRAVPNARLFLHVHDEFLSLLPERVVRPRLEDLSAVVTCSNFVTQRLQARLPYLADRIHTVGNGVDTSYFETSERFAEPGKFHILYVGRVSPEKGIHTLAAAFTRLATTDEGVELDVVGPPGLLPFNQIRLLSGDPQIAALESFYGTGFWSRLDKQLVHARSSYRRDIEASIPAALRNRVHFRGQLSRGTLRSAYQRAHVLALPSVCMEPFGLPLAEAMATGLACVASRTGGIPDILADNVTGLLVERGDVEALTNALRKLSVDSEAREQMGREARRRAEEHFDWSVPAARLESLYRQQWDAPLGESVQVSSATAVAAPPTGFQEQRALLSRRCVQFTLAQSYGNNRARPASSVWT
jgi:glycosyltransferase involved in cell wall biosynthesis